MSDSPTRVLISGDHSTYHGGSAAVIEAIRHLLRGENVTLTSPGEPFDVLLVNGEGSMHHDSSECVAKMARIEAAQMLGKKTGLINAVWQENSGRFDTILRRLDILTLRGPASAKDLHDRHGIAAFHHPDLSLFAPLTACAPKVDYGGAAVVTDYFDHVFGGFVRSTSGPLARLPYFDLAAHGWSDAIATLATASAVVTGRHHVMYAALRARVPFVLLEANTHKLQDLLDAAGVTLPICRTQAEVLAALQHIGLNRRIYDQLFDWAASQSPPDLLRMTEAQPLARTQGASRL
ncbi:MAG: polysaccharide pyruvyl transferase family protein, partial [Gemmobacter sp.]|uniref:polysaccharide pyruvyl transferase family protein n=1 Tax=Gemmobacter sp. TaxID=1898957 RepID=UPI001A470298